MSTRSSKKNRKTNPNSNLAGRLPALCTVLIGILGVFDYYTGLELRLFVFYFIPIAILSWKINRFWGLVAAFLSSIVWIISNATDVEASPNLNVWLWNFGIMLTAFLVVASLFDRLRQDRDDLVALATRDQLTGLLNRRAFHVDIDRELARARRYHRPVALAFLDIDGFKKLNDTYGHTAGDEALVIVAKVIARCVRSTDFCARLGGDEFVILFPETNAESALHATEKVLARLRSIIARRKLPISFSIGLISCPSEILPSGDELIAHADALMYEAKSTGKDRIVAGEIKAGGIVSFMDRND